MKQILMVFSLLLLGGCAAQHSISVATPATPIAPDPFSQYWTAAVAKTVQVRPDADVAKLLTVQPAIAYVPIQQQAINPKSGNAGFFLDGIPNVPQAALNAAQLYPDSTVDGRLLVRGYTDVYTPGKIIVYFTLGSEPVIEHENLHAIWFLLYPAEQCPDGHYIWETVEHGISCDPFNASVN